MDLPDLRRLLAYDQWANRAALATLGGEGVPPRAIALLAHVAATQGHWLARLEGRPSLHPVWPEWDLARISAELDALPAAWDAYLAARPADGLAGTITYATSRGESWTSAAADVLVHVVNHGTYHRGQVAILLGAAGREPASTDFIEAVRRGHVA